MNTIILIFLDILILFSAIVIAKSTTDSKKRFYAMCSGIVLIIAVMLLTLIVTRTNEQTFNSKKYNYTVEIKQTIVNDSLIKLDTIYILTYKK